MKPTKKLMKFVSNVVARSTSTTVRYPRTDPPVFKKDRPFRRVVRYPVGATETNISPQKIAQTEAQYYFTPAPAGGRWQNVKILAATFYGAPNVDEIEVIQNANGNVGQTTYNDGGDLNHRPCIKLIMPPTQVVDNSSATTARFTFATGIIDFVDVYVEFS